MNFKNLIKSTFIVIGVLLLIGKVNAQEVEKVFFAKTIPTKIEIKDSYSFTVGYVVNSNSDIAIEVSGGPNKFWVSKVFQVKAGRGILQVKLSPESKPTAGKGYRLNLSIRPRKGDWRTTRTGIMINNLEFVNEEIRVPESISFSPLTPNIVESSNVYNFEIDYNLLEEHLVQVSVWNDKDWLATSKKVAIQPGKGTQNIIVKMDPPAEGTKYKYLLTFGTQEEFKNKQTKSKEVSGIYIYKSDKTPAGAAASTSVKPEKQLTLKEINEKSVQLAVNKASEILTLPGAASFQFIKIITLKGEIILEEKETNSIKISDLTQGAYFAITSEGDYYKFVKL